MTRHTTTPTDDPAAGLALAVWPPASTRGRRDRYLTASGRHRIPPELAARAILAYSDPGDLVVDPDCHNGTVLVEAIHAGRRAVGATTDPADAALATANISRARHQGAPGRATVIEGEPADLPSLLAKAAPVLHPPGYDQRVRRHPAGSVQLILTETPGPVAAPSERWRRVLAPGGFLLLAHTPPAGGNRPGLGGFVAAAAEAGLDYWQHVVALRTGDSGELHHLSVLAFRKPDADTTRHVAAVRPRVPAKGGRGMNASRQSVWPVGDQPARVQRHGRYLPTSTAHPGKMLPALARQAISLYSKPGDLVCDPMCGIGTTLVEAVHLGRHAVGVELEPRWAALANDNVVHARREGAPGHGQAVCGDASRLGCGLLDRYTGQVALILTSPPYGPSLHGQVRKGKNGVRKSPNYRYSSNPDNLAHLPQAAGRKPAFEAVLGEILVGCRRMLTPNGRLVMTVRPYRRGGRLVDLPGQLEQLAADNGLQLCDRHAALLCGLEGERVVPHASFFQIRHQRSGAFPRMLIIAHEDVLVFKPTTTRPTIEARLGAKAARAAQ